MENEDWPYRATQKRTFRYVDINDKRVIIANNLFMGDGATEGFPIDGEEVRVLVKGTTTKDGYFDDPVYEGICLDEEFTRASHDADSLLDDEEAMNERQKDYRKDLL